MLGQKILDPCVTDILTTSFLMIFELVHGEFIIFHNLDTFRSLVWNENDLQKKLNDFTDYYNNHRAHSSLHGSVPKECSAKRTSPFAN